MRKLFLILFCFVAGTLLSGCTKDKWEYKTFVAESEGHERTGANAGKFSTINPDLNELQKLGNEGWELATSYLEMETAYTNFGDENLVVGIQPNVRPQRIVLIFKRKK